MTKKRRAVSGWTPDSSCDQVWELEALCAETSDISQASCLGGRLLTPRRRMVSAAQVKSMAENMSAPQQRRARPARYVLFLGPPMRSRLIFDNAFRSCVVAAFLLLAGCGWAADPNKTTDRITADHILRAGVSENRPWIWFEGDQARGPEAELIQRFAATLGAQLRWTRGAQAPLLEQLKQRRLDLAAGGFTDDDPHTSELGTSRPFAGGGL